MSIEPPGSADLGESRRESPRAALYHAVFEHAPSAQLIADDHRHYLDGNLAARRFLGVSREALVASRIDDYVIASMRSGLDEMWETFLTRGSMEGVFPLQLPNGLQRRIVFRAKANVRTGRHLSSFDVAPSEHQSSGLEFTAAQTRPPLTSREREILTLLARGATLESIGERLTLSVETVRTHVRNSMRKLDARSRPHAVAVAIRLREIDP